MRSADATSKLEIRYDTGPEREAEAIAAKQQQTQVPQCVLDGALR